MKTLRVVLFVTSVLGIIAAGAVFAAGPAPSPKLDPCLAQQAAVDQAQAAMKTTPEASSAGVARSVKAAFKAKRQALLCCRSPKLASCAR
jgi:hypothetical protein